MKKTILILFAILNAFLASAQTDRYIPDEPINKKDIPFTKASQRLNVDFEIKGKIQVSEATLESINLFAIDESRQLDSRVEIVDVPTGLTLVIYSVTEATRNKGIVLFGGVE